MYVLHYNLVFIINHSEILTLMIKSRIKNLKQMKFALKFTSHSLQCIHCNGENNLQSLMQTIFTQVTSDALNFIINTVVTQYCVYYEI